MTEHPTVGVVGAGQMGSGIAQVASSVAKRVHLLDVTDTRVDAGIAHLRKGLDRLVAKGMLDGAEREARLARVRGTIQASDLVECDLVIEAVTEKLEVKLEIFRELDSLVKTDGILASNTSSISLTKLAAGTRRADRVIGMHFMNPVPVMKLVEVVRALQTSDATYDAACALAAAMGKTVVTTRDMPGFVVNRMLIPFINEACFALQDGVGTVDDIDQGARLGLNHPMGPLELADLIGLDTCLFIAEVLQREFGDDKYRPPALLRNYVAAGWLGRKTDRGFYTYTDGRPDRPSGLPPQTQGG